MNIFTSHRYIEKARQGILSLTRTFLGGREKVEKLQILQFAHVSEIYLIIEKCEQAVSWPSDRL